VLQAVRIFETKVVSRIKSDMTFHRIKRIALFKSAVPKLLNAGPNSRSYQRPRAGLLCVLKKKQKSKKATRHYHSGLYTGIAIYFICSETCLKCDL